MSVFETLVRTRSGQETLEASVLPSDIMMTALVPIEVSAATSTNVGIAIANPNTALASLILTLRRSDGTQFSTTTINISARRQISRFVTELFPGAVQGGFSNTTVIPAEFSGTLVVTSNAPVSTLALKLRGEDFSVLPVTNLAPTANLIFPTISTGVGGLEAVLFPQFVTGDGWATEIEITNTTANSLTVRVDLFTQDGVPLPVRLNGVTASTFPNLIVPANGLLKLRP
jgi:hypothetical protein